MVREEGDSNPPIPRSPPPPPTLNCLLSQRTTWQLKT